MTLLHRSCLIASLFGVLLGNASARAQLGPSLRQFELADSVQLDRADNAVLAQLERVKAFLADKQWDEAVETLRQIAQTADGKLLGATEWRYVSLRDYCHLQLAALPPEALKLYRARVDADARKWYEEGVAKRDRRLLQSVVDQAFAGSWGDDALLALGEMALEKGDYAAARWHWERIVPARPPADTPPTWPGYPDSDLDLASVRARLVLVSILEGSSARAREELAQFARLHPQAKGRLAGREVVHAEALAELLAESAAWPPPKPSADWPTFAGCGARNRAAARLIDVAEVAWRMPLPKVRPALNASLASVAEDADAPLSYHPLLWNGMVLVAGQMDVRAVRLSTGQPAWGSAGAAIYRDALEGSSAEFANPRETLGTARFTATVYDGRLYARMGAAVTSRPPESLPTLGKGYLVCLDLAAEGRLAWKLAPEEGFAFEGAPLCDGANVYAAMRRSDVRPQAHVACLDAQTGRPRWRRFIAGAETPARGMLYESTHALLTLQGGVLYFNTNLGAVAALSADDGRVLWATLYPRARSGDLAQPAPHWQRDLTPCVFDRGTLLAAPADSPRIFGLDAATGQIVWQTGTQVEDAVHLLGTCGEQLIAGGRRLYWIGTQPEDKGRIRHVWPEGDARPGFGRGVLAGGLVLFPTREKLGDRVMHRIHLFDGQTAELKKVIDLDFRGKPPVAAGNLLVAGGQLLIATGNELICLKIRD